MLPLKIKGGPLSPLCIEWMPACFLSFVPTFAGSFAESARKIRLEMAPCSV